MSHLIQCPRCGGDNFQAGFPAWQWITAILLFPFGLLAFFCGRKATKCTNCSARYYANSSRIQIPMKGDLPPIAYVGRKEIRG